MSANRAVVLQSIARVSARELHLIAARSEAGIDVLDGADKVGALLDAARALDSIRAPYALIGGVAVGLHTCHPRATLDTDLAVHTSHRGAPLNAILVAAGFELRGEYAHSANFRHASGEPLQFAFDTGFDAMIERVEVFEVEGVTIRVVTKDDLVAMKRRAAADPAQRRSKALRNQADIELLLGDVPDADEGW